MEAVPQDVELRRSIEPLDLVNMNASGSMLVTYKRGSRKAGPATILNNLASSLWYIPWSTRRHERHGLRLCTIELQTGRKIKAVWRQGVVNSIKKRHNVLRASII